MKHREVILLPFWPTEQQNHFFLVPRGPLVLPFIGPHVGPSARISSPFLFSSSLPPSPPPPPAYGQQATGHFTTLGRTVVRCLILEVRNRHLATILPMVLEEEGVWSSV